MTTVRFQHPDETPSHLRGADQCIEKLLGNLLETDRNVCSCHEPWITVVVDGMWHLGELDNLELSACCLRRLNFATDQLSEDRHERIRSNQHRTALRAFTHLRALAKLA